mgnify:CR=1 FL=1
MADTDASGRIIDADIVFWDAAFRMDPMMAPSRRGQLRIKNYRTGFTWRLMQRCPFIVSGLCRAGFRGGWLGS